MDGRFEAVDRRFEGLERRLDALDQKLDQRTDALRADLGQLDQKVARQFVWLVGAHMTTLLAIVGAVVAALLAR